MTAVTWAIDFASLRLGSTGYEPDPQRRRSRTALPTRRTSRGRPVARGLLRHRGPPIPAGTPNSVAPRRQYLGRYESVTTSAQSSEPLDRSQIRTRAYAIFCRRVPMSKRGRSRTATLVGGSLRGARASGSTAPAAPAGCVPSAAQRAHGQPALIRRPRAPIEQIRVRFRLLGRTTQVVL